MEELERKTEEKMIQKKELRRKIKEKTCEVWKKAVPLHGCYVITA